MKKKKKRKMDTLDSDNKKIKEEVEAYYSYLNVNE